MTKSSNASPDERATRARLTSLSRPMLCAMVCVGSLAACEDKKPQVVAQAPQAEAPAEAPSAAEVQWEALQSKLADADTSQPKRLALLHAFQRKHRKTVYAEQARELVTQMNAQRKMTRVCERASSYVERGVRRAWGESFASTSLSASPQRLRDVVMFEVVRDMYRFSTRSKQPFEAVTLVGASGDTRRVDRPVLMGLGVARLNFMGAVSMSLPAFKVKGCVGVGDRACYQQTVNALSKAIVGQPVYKGPAQMNPKAVGAMLKSLGLADKGASLLGLPTGKIL